MKYVQINKTVTAWAKSIVLGKHRKLLAAGHDSYVFWGRGPGEENEYCRRFATDFDSYADALLTRIDGKPCFHSKRATRKLLGWLDEIDPDVVHLHNLLGYYINIEMLFNWLANHRCKVVWTIHDCSPFTGHCVHFTYVKCTQWKTHCAYEKPCPQPNTYPETFHRNMEAWNFEQKKQLFTMLPPERMSLITPSQWLADLVKQSYLAKYDVTVVHNTVDTDVFKPTPSDFRERYGIGDRFMILGVAAKWSERKGLDDLIRLANDLDESYVIVLIGLSKRQIREVGDKVIALPKTDTPQELAAAYTAADIHVQPSIEETFGMTVAEAQACGTPVVVMKGSACAEIAKPRLAFLSDRSIKSLEATVMEAKASLQNHKKDK